ncbi:MAG: peptidoglycan-binding protein, partial [Actinomycetota bacterium]|nr:peptidoglycan-binding protein [Actinomycetota bacterium]
LRLQSLLRNPLGYDPGPIDGIFGSKTETAVKEYQTNNGLVADGIVGPRTWALLNEA